MYTSHGHLIPGTVEGPERPLFIARCGGPRVCSQCSREVASYYYPTPLPVEEPIEAPASFHEDLRKVINRHSKENRSNTPDYILADYLVACLDIFGATVELREGWWGRPRDGFESFSEGVKNAKP